MDLIETDLIPIIEFAYQLYINLINLIMIENENENTTCARLYDLIENQITYADLVK